MASLGQIIFYSMVFLIIVVSGLIIIILACAFSGKTSSALSLDKSPVGNLDENQLLSCYLHTDTTRVPRMSVTWEKKGLTGVVYRFENGGADLTNQSPQFKGRAQLFPEALILGNASLLLTAVRREDQGDYTCSISSSAGGGSVTIHLRTGAFSAPSFTLLNNTLIAVAERWFPEPSVIWSDHSGRVLNGSTSLKANSAGIYSVKSLLQPINISDTYTLRIKNELKVAVSEATITGSGVIQQTYFYNNKASLLLQPSIHLNVMSTVLWIGLTISLSL